MMPGLVDEPQRFQRIENGCLWLANAYKDNIRQNVKGKLEGGHEWEVKAEEQSTERSWLRSQTRLLISCTSRISRSAHSFSPTLGHPGPHSPTMSLSNPMVTNLVISLGAMQGLSVQCQVSNCKFLTLLLLGRHSGTQNGFRGPANAALRAHWLCDNTNCHPARLLLYCVQGLLSTCSAGPASARLTRHSADPRKERHDHPQVW